MIKNLSALARGRLSASATQETRVYIDPRRIEYAPISGTDTYYTNAVDEPAQGGYSLDQSTFYTCYPFTVPITFECYVKPNFAYDVATDQMFCKFYADAYDGAYVALYYDATSDKLGVKVYQNLAGAGGAAITTASAQLAHQYVSDATLQTWHRLTVVVSLGSITIYNNGALAVTTNVFMNNIRKLCLFSPGNNVDCYINYIKVYPGLEATAAQILNHFQNINNEHAYWGFQQCAIGRTRCDVTKPYCHSLGFESKDGYKATTAKAALRSQSGEFCTDQYATYAPESGSYNGTASQKYLANSIGLTIEQPLFSIAEATDAPFEQLFYGTCDAGTFQPSTNVGQLTIVHISADDFMKQLVRRRVRTARTFDNYYLARATPSNNSLWHEFVWLSAKKEIYNYVGNSGFENTTIGNSWTCAGTGAAIARSSTRPLFGTYSCNLTGAPGNLSLIQSISDTAAQPTFDEGMSLTLQAFVYLEDGNSITFKIQEYDGVTGGSYTSGTETHSGTGWAMYYLTHTLVDASRDSVKLTITTDSLDSRYDGVMLTQGLSKQFYVQNATDGTAGVCAAANEASGTYLQIGCVSEDVPYQIPWGFIDRNGVALDRAKEVADASLARYMHITKHGTLEMASHMTSDDETVSRGVIPDVFGKATTTQNPIANKITVEGVYYYKGSALSCLWEAKSALVGNENTEGTEFYYNLPNTDYFPDIAVEPTGLECVYADTGTIVIAKRSK
jgi:hypothetical protein